MYDLGERATIGLHDGAQRAIGRISEANDVRRDVVGGETKDGAGFVLIADGGVTAANAKVGGGQQDRVGRLAEVVAVEGEEPFFFGFGNEEHDCGLGSGDVPGALPHVAESNELCSLGHDDELPALPIRRRRRSPPGLQNLVEVVAGDRLVGIGPHVAPGADRIPRFHGERLAPGCGIPTKLLRFGGLMDAEEEIAMTAVSRVTNHDVTAEADSFTQEWTRWHRQHEASTGGKHGFLAITSINWLTARPQRLTDAPGEWYTDDSGVHVNLADGEAIVVDGETVTGDFHFGTIPERGGQTVGWNDAAIEVAKRGGRDIVRPRHPEAPIVSAYRGTPAYAPRQQWVVQGRFVAFDAPKPITVDGAVEGIEHVYQSPGHVDFVIDDEPQSLVVFADKPERGLFALFTDATSGVSTYAACRSLFIETPAADGSVQLDFNRATNLPCAYTDFATCPLPPADNRLSVAIEAGELLPYERQR
ncbi:MAG: hypothetical protein JWL70_2383 [Acidimicrobiia bacterium]|nr:hypothetical protein [Acidimicrobiia bacterium]